MMTIIIPTWIVITIIVLIVLRILVNLNRGKQFIKGAKIVWPEIKQFINSDEFKEYLKK